MNFTKIGFLGLCLISVVISNSCAKKKTTTSSETTIQFKPPAVAPIVNASLPSALKAANSTAASVFSTPLTGVTGLTYHDEYLDLFQKNTHSEKLSYYDGHFAPLAAVVVTNTNSTVAQENIYNLFNMSFNDINAGTIQWQGYLNTQVIQIDERMKDGPMSSAMPCLAETAKTFNVDLSTVDPMLNFTLEQLQCYGALGSDTTGATTGGMAFGQQGSSCQTVAATPVPTAVPVAMGSPLPFTAGSKTGGCNFSLMLSLIGLNSTFTTAGGFLVLANIVNAGSTTANAPQYVDALSVSYSPQSQNNRVTIVRFRAVPSLNTFEMHYAANVAEIAGVNTESKAYLGAGFRMISDGVHIYADGQVWRPSPAAWLPFNVCLNASDNSVVNLTTGNNQVECDSLANSFSLSSSGSVDLSYYELTGSTLGSTIPGYVATSAQTPPSTALINLLSNAYNVKNVSSSATKSF